MEVPLSREERIRAIESKVAAECEVERIKESLRTDLTIDEIEKKIEHLKKQQLKSASEIAIRLDSKFKVIKEAFEKAIEDIKNNQNKISHAITRKFQVSQRFDNEIARLENTIKNLKEQKKHEIIDFEELITHGEKSKDILNNNLQVSEDNLVNHCKTKGINYEDFLKLKEDIISYPSVKKANTDVGESVLDMVDSKFFQENVYKRWGTWKKLLFNRGIIVLLDRSGIKPGEEINGVKAKNALRNCTLKAI